jgi:hypothetical protein
MVSFQEARRARQVRAYETFRHAQEADLAAWRKRREVLAGLALSTCFQLRVAPQHAQQVLAEALLIVLAALEAHEDSRPPDPYDFATYLKHQRSTSPPS